MFFAITPFRKGWLAVEKQWYDEMLIEMTANPSLYEGFKLAHVECEPTQELMAA